MTASEDQSDYNDYHDNEIDPSSSTRGGIKIKTSTSATWTRADDVVSVMATINTHATGNGFLTNFNDTTPKIYITAETDSVGEFDQRTLLSWRREGFDVEYLPFHSNATNASFSDTLKRIAQSTGLGEKFGIVAYGDAASVCLDFFARPSARLCCLVAYYPGIVPDPKIQFPIGLKVLVHLAGSQEISVRKRHEILGIQGKKTVTEKSVPKGTGCGGLVASVKWPAYVYEGVEAGFAERDLDEFDSIAERIAWSRSLDCVRKAFGVVSDLEHVWEDNCQAKYKTGNVDKLIETMTEKPSINFVPVRVGGNDQKDIREFYEDYFLPDTPPSFRYKLISRTVGSDQIVDELIVNFDHTQEVSWILPCIPATNKHVEIAMVVVVSIRGGKIQHENTYWDQASVLVQVGLLDPEMASPKMKKLGVERLPISGPEGAQKVQDRSKPSNEMLDDW